MATKLITILLLCVSVSACSLFSPREKVTTITDTKIVVPDIIPPPDPKPVELKDVDWTVLNLQELTSESLQALKDKATKEKKQVYIVLLDPKDLKGIGANVVLFAVTVEDYEDMATNMAEIIRLIKEQRAILVYYRDLPDLLKKAAEDAEKKVKEEKAKQKAEDEKKSKKKFLGIF